MPSVSVLAVLAAAACLVVVAATPVGHASVHRASTDAATKPRVTFVGDSISASLDYVPSARRLLSHGFRLHFDLEVCRRLVATSCSFQGDTPATALQVVASLDRSVGDVLIVNVGYNEGSTGYREGMRKVIRAARAQGVRGIVWVTLRETRDIYRSTNRAIRKEAKRREDVQVADWATYSGGKPWFREDGLHLNKTGATGLARLVRAKVLSVV